MTTKTVSQLDAEGFFVGETTAYESPLQPGVFHIPAGAIDRAPPKTIEQGKRYRPWGTGWRGEAIPAQEPEQTLPEPTPEELRRAAIVARLYQIDQESIRPARAVAAALAAGQTVPPFDAKKLAAMEAEAATLREELRTM